jgi:hypothetical protein
MQALNAASMPPRTGITSGLQLAASETVAFTRGIGHGFGKEASSAFTDLKVIGRVFRDTGVRSGFSLLRDGIREMGRSQNGVRDALAGAFITPIRTDINEGRTSQAIGRAGFHIVTMVFPGDKVIRAAAAVAARSAETAAPSITAVHTLR